MTPLSWYGGKFYMVKPILKVLADLPHQTYVEVFGGAGHLVFAKTPSPIDVYNDLNEGLYNFFKVLREQPDELHKALSLTPYSRQEFQNCGNWHLVTDPVEKARQFFVATQASYGVKGHRAGWSWVKTESNRGMAARVSKWLFAIDTKLPQAVGRARQLQVENLDFAELITKYDTPNTLFYCDPPYLPKTRTAKKVYDHEMPYEEHVRLVEVLKGIRGKAILSGYNNVLYDTLGWEKKSIGHYALVTSRVAKKRKKVEFIWVKR